MARVRGTTRTPARAAARASAASRASSSRGANDRLGTSRTAYGRREVEQVFAVREEAAVVYSNGQLGSVSDSLSQWDPKLHPKRTTDYRAQCRKWRSGKGKVVQLHTERGEHICMPETHITNFYSPLNLHKFKHSGGAVTNGVGAPQT